MAEAKDPAIKLFGKTIPLPDTPPPPPPPAAAAAAAEEEAAVGCSSTADDVMELTSPYNNDRNDDDDDDDDDIITTPPADEERESSCGGGGGGGDKDDQDGNSSHTKQSGVSPQGPDKNACQDPSLETADNSETLSGADEKVEAKASKSEEEKMETDVSQEKTLKKPDKILPCPRCNSMDTKFCYYNNYNVNQPRHFCKKCQRYWTAGGTMRNVPVGAGRRKNKSSASQYRQITVPDALQSSRSDMPNGIHPGLQTNGTVLTFGSDSPLCESMASILNIAEKTMRSCPTQNGFQKPEELKVQVPIVALETGCQVGGSNLEDATKSSPKDLAPQSCLPYPAQIPCYPGAPWPYPWNSAHWSPPVAAAPFCPNGLALPFYPAPAYWGCTVPGTWSIPWMPQPPLTSQSAPNSSPNSPTLGKHSRDGNVLTSTSSEDKGSEDKGAERSLWIPKTLRIDDPGEAAKSSIWTTLGIKHNEKPESIGRGSGLFKAFQSKSDERNPNVEISTVLEANPAALSRSQNFQENS